EGIGKLQGMVGMVVVNGYLTPPQGLFLNFIARFLDPSGRLRSRSPLSPLQPITDPDPGTTFLVLRGEVDPERPVKLNYGADGRVVGSNLFEIQRLVHIGFDVGTAAGLRTSVRKGPVVGHLRTTTFFDPFSQASPIPLQTRNGLFTFCDRTGEPI